MQDFEDNGTTPAFVLATRLFVRYKFKTHRSFDPQAVLAHDAAAREMLAAVRATRDGQLLAMADRFEQARFGLRASSAPVARQPESPRNQPFLDLSLENPG